jgi:hypothetical protein
MIDSLELSTKGIVDNFGAKCGENSKIYLISRTLIRGGTPQ